MAAVDCKARPVADDVKDEKQKFGDLRLLLKSDKIRRVLHSFLETPQLCVLCRVSKWWRSYLVGAEQDHKLWLSANLACSVAHAVTDKILLALFEAHPSIEHLNIRFCSKITDLTLLAAAKFLPNLRTLALEGCGRTLQDKGVQALARCTKLVELDLNGCFRISAKAIQHVVSACPDLISLSISGIPAVDDGTIRSILRAHGGGKLSCLNLNSCSRITDESLRMLAVLGSKLTELQIAYCLGISDAGIAELAKACPNISLLNLYGCSHLTDQSLGALASLHLKELNLSMCRAMSDAGLRQLLEGKGSTALESLNLYDCTKITDVTIKALTRCPRLRFLGVFGLDGLTPEAVQEFLASAKALERIELGGCQKIRLEHIAAFSQSFPRVAF